MGKMNDLYLSLQELGSDTILEIEKTVVWLKSLNSFTSSEIIKAIADEYNIPETAAILIWKTAASHDMSKMIRKLEMEHDI